MGMPLGLDEEKYAITFSIFCVDNSRKISHRRNPFTIVTLCWDYNNMIRYDII